MAWANSGSLGRGRPFSATQVPQDQARMHLLGAAPARPLVFVASVGRNGGASGAGGVRVAQYERNMSVGNPHS